MMKDILREIGMIARALDSISNIEFKEHDLTKGQYLYILHRQCNKKISIRCRFGGVAGVNERT